MDQLGSVSGITNNLGERAERRNYHPFGVISWDDTLDTTLTTETKGFVGERYDADAGLQYLNARYYDPELALFIQPDWFPVTAPGVGTNRYSYSANDPVNLRDPNGNFFLRGFIGGIIGGIVGGLADLGSQLKDGTPLGDVDVGSIAKSAGAGAVAGALAGAFGPAAAGALGAEGVVAGIGVEAAVGAAAGATGQVAANVGENAINGDPLGQGITDGVGSAALGGAIGGAAGGAFGKAVGETAATTTARSAATAGASKTIGGAATSSTAAEAVARGFNAARDAVRGAIDSMRDDDDNDERGVDGAGM